MRLKLARRVATVVALIFSLNAPQVFAAKIEDFYGTYAGDAVATTSSGKQNRKLEVEISKDGKGFRIDWQTQIKKPNGKVSNREYTIGFRTTDREGIYSSAMKPNLFGGSQPMDPMKGDPYVWATLGGDTLTVYAMLVTPSGDYEMQVYERTLTDAGMDLEFSRYSRATLLSHVSAKLKRKKKSGY